MIKVLVVDDSAFMRKILGDLIGEEADLVVVDKARDGVDALEKVSACLPDVVTLDIEMPRMDGLTALKHIVNEHRLPVILISSLTSKGARTTLQGLSAGAVDFMAKPKKLFGGHWDGLQRDLVQKIRAAYQARGRVAAASRPTDSQIICRTPKQETGSPAPTTGPPARLVAVGSSTGGPPALETLLASLPPSSDTAVMVTQHMPAGFTRSLAQRLDRLSPWRVVEASASDSLKGGTVYIAPGGYHLVLRSGHRLGLDEGPPVHHVRPAVDVMFNSIAYSFGQPICAAVLTGMGRDGAEGLARLRMVGAHTLAEAEETCVIFGMPRAAIEQDAVDQVVPIDGMGSAIANWMGRL